jgi:hypothetical protein
MSQLHGFSTTLPDAGDAVSKIGRATGFTQSKYSGLRACSVAKRRVNGADVEFETWEHVVSLPGDIFLQHGDSGSLAFNNDGKVVGLLFGGSYTGDTAYFTSTSDLLADIRKVTGLNEIRIVGEV